MNKKRFLIFLLAGLVLALILGVLVYWATLENRQGADPERVFRSFITEINAGNMTAARGMLTKDSRDSLRNPSTALGKAVYHSLKIGSIENIIPVEEKDWMADVTLQTLDTLQVMSKANVDYWEWLSESTEKPNVETQNRKLADIYDQLLARDDLPLYTYFCIVTFQDEDGTLKIQADAKLIQALEGNLTDHAEAVDALMQVITTEEETQSTGNGEDE